MMKKSIPWIAILLFILAVSARILPGARTIDDSFITYRYARNILAGEGFIYNPGERVLGTTTPLYTLLMATAGAISGGIQAPFPQISLVLNALFDGITVVFLWQFGKRFKVPLAGFGAGLAWAIAPYSVTFAIGGLETSLYVLLLVSCAYFYVNERITSASFLAGLAILTRPDAVLLVAPLAIDHLIRVLRRDQPLRIRDLLALGLLPLVWFAFATWYFGSVIPHSVQAKMGAYLLQPEEALVRLLQHFATPFMQQRWFGPMIAVAGGLILYPFLYLVGSRSMVRQNNRSLPVLIYPWFYLIVYAVANPLIFRWYLTPPLPIYFLGILAGIETFISQLFAGVKFRISPILKQITLILLVIVLPTSSLLSGWALKPDHGLSRPAPDMAWYKLELLYAQAAEIVKPLLPTDGVLAAGDVGVLGYQTGARILDTVGLNSAVTKGYYPLNPDQYVTNYAISPDLIIDQQPDVIVFLKVYGRLSLLLDERFLSQYHLQEKIPTDIYGSDGMLIYVHNNS